MKELLRKYIKENLEVSKISLFSKMRASFFEEDYVEAEENFETSTPRECIVSITEFINENKNKYSNFQTLLFKLIDERNLTDPEVYNKVYFDRRQFSKIRCNHNYHPSKETVILLGLSLELSVEELEELLESAAYSLPKNNHYDLIIRFCFINKIYKLTEVNELLAEYKCKLFNY